MSEISSSAGASAPSPRQLRRSSVRQLRIFRHQCAAELDRHAFARSGEVQHAAPRFVAVLAQQQALRAQLHPLGLPGAARHMRPLAALVIDRGDAAAFALDQIELADDAERLRAERHRERMNRLVLSGRRRQFTAGPIHAAMPETAFDCIGRIRPFPRHPFQPGQAGAMDEFVQHAHGNRENAEGTFRTASGEVRHCVHDILAVAIRARY